MANFFQISNLSLAKQNPNQLKCMTDAVQFSNLQKQPKKVLKTICEDLGWAQKMKKEEIMKRLPSELLRIQQQGVDSDIFRKHKILNEIIRKYSELWTKSLPSQQRFPMNGMNPMAGMNPMNPMQPLFAYLPYLQHMQMMPQAMQQMMPQAVQQMMPQQVSQTQQQQQQQIMMQYPYMFQPNQFQRPTVQSQQFSWNDQIQQAAAQTETVSIYSYCPCKVQPFRRKEINSQDVKCINCENRVHLACMNITQEKERTSFECPQCVLNLIDPLNPVVRLYGRMLMSGEPKQFQGGDIKMNFILNQDDINLLSQGHALEIRCIRLDIKYINEITWPDVGELLLNTTKVLEFKPLVLNSSLKKRKDEKFNTSDMTLLQKTVNTVWLKDTQVCENKQQYKLSEDAVYLMSVVLVQKLTPTDLIKQIKGDSKRFRTKDESINQIRRQCQNGQVNDSQEGEVSISSVTVSLKCQFDSMMIETPCRGRFCEHIQCFSLENIIRMTSSVTPRKWKCPICKQKTFHLMIDTYQQQIIEQYRLIGTSVREITFDRNGTTIEEKHDKTSQSEDDSDEIQPNKPQENSKQLQKPCDILVLDEEVPQMEIAEENISENPLVEPNQLANDKMDEESPVNLQQQVNEENLQISAEVPHDSSNNERQQSQVNLGNSHGQSNSNQPQVLPQSLIEQLKEQANKQKQFEQLQHFGIQQQKPLMLDQAQMYLNLIMKQKQQSLFHQHKQKDKDDYRKFDQYQSIQNQVQHNRSLKDYVDKHDEQLTMKYSKMKGNLNEAHVVTQKLTFSKWKTSSSQIGECSQQQEKKEITDSIIKSTVKQKEKMIKVVKKQFPDLIRRNCGTLDNPIYQQFQQQRLASQPKSKGIFKLSSQTEALLAKNQNYAAFIQEKWLMEQLARQNQKAEIYNRLKMQSLPQQQQVQGSQILDLLQHISQKKEIQQQPQALQQLISQPKQIGLSEDPICIEDD